VSALPVVILISGRGSNMLALAARAAELGFDIRAVLADRADAAGLEAARILGLDAAAVPRRDYADRAAHEAAMLARMYPASTTSAYWPRARPATAAPYISSLRSSTPARRSCRHACR
jgi:cysteine synthase